MSNGRQVRRLGGNYVESEGSTSTGRQIRQLGGKQVYLSPSRRSTAFTAHHFQADLMRFLLDSVDEAWTPHGRPSGRELKSRFLIELVVFLGNSRIRKIKSQGYSL